MRKSSTHINDWNKASVKSTASMKDVLMTISEGNMQIALVVDDSCHLAGTVTDGDIRRALLRGDDLDTPINAFMNANPITGLLDEDESLWQRTMQRHTLRHLPLLDAKGCVVGLARFEQPKEPKRDNPVILMAGGLGTRLHPLTHSQPKPLLEVGSKPILETIIENFADHGFYNIFLCINYKGEMIKKYFGDGSRWDVDIKYIEEPRRMGTAGALSLLPNKPEVPFFVMNSDLLTKVDFVRLLHFHQKHTASATLCTREYAHQIPYGVINLEGHEVVDMVEKPTHRFNVNAGIYVLEPDTLDNIPSDCYFDMPSLIDKLLEQKKLVGSFPIHEYWIDIGRMQEFKQAHDDYEEQFHNEQ
jgi:dTDP-glucose pyrophosphorylase